MRHRRSFRRLACTRIYPKRRRFYFYSAEPIYNPVTKKMAKWHSLCLITDGEAKARKLAQAIVDYNRCGAIGRGDLPDYMRLYLVDVMKKRAGKAPIDPARLKMHDAASNEIWRICRIIEKSFADFDVNQVAPVNVAAFLDNWEGQRMAQVYKARMTHFMAWCVRKGVRDDNPCRDISVEEPTSRSRYITDAEFNAIRDHLAPMARCYVDLCYLLYQRTTEIRLLRKDQIKPEGIYFKPTKTEASSGARVLLPMTPEIREVLDRANACGFTSNDYVIHTSDGQPYTTTGIASAWKRACIKAEVQGATLKDLRAKALTDAKKAGYRIEQISVGAAHTNTEQTLKYIKTRETPVSEVLMHLPPQSN